MKNMNEEVNMQDLINMKLHEQKEILGRQYVITRVPGGWIYCRQEPQVNIAHPVFVPFIKPQ